jgi:hypothetical protein
MSRLFLSRNIEDGWSDHEIGCGNVRAGMLAHNPLSTFQGVNHGGSDDSNMGCQHLQPKDSCMFNATYPCSDSLSMAACMFKCSGKSDFVHGLRANVTLDVQAEWWHNHLTSKCWPPPCVIAARFRRDIFSYPTN